MGWFEQDLNQIKTYSHGGNLPDFSAFMGLVPGQKKAFIVLFNADPYGLPFITDEVGMGLTALLADQSSPPIKLDFIRWIFRLLPLIPLIQAAGVVVTLRFLHRWQRNPASRPSRGRMWRQPGCISGDTSVRFCMSRPTGRSIRAIPPPAAGDVSCRLLLLSTRVS